MPFEPQVETVECDVLVVGGGMAGYGAAFEAANWARGRGLRVCLGEKAAIERSGPVAMGLSAINMYMGMQWGENQPEDFVRYVRQDLMGLSREDLVYDLARHVDSSVHMFEEWGLPIFKNEDGHYKREGRWQIMIHGESYKPIVAEASKNAFGEIVEETRGKELEEWAPYGTAKPVPTPLRNHLMLNDIKDGRGPHYMRTDEALQRMFAEAQNDPKKIAEIESDAWEDFLDMTMSQAHIWASQNIDPSKTPSELILTEPYLMGSHASATGAWCSGPEDAAPDGSCGRSNRITTVKGLFAAGDACGASAHKFSSGSYTEGRLAGKAAVQYVLDNNDVRHDQGAVADTIRELYRPFNEYGEHQHETSRPELNAHYLLPKMALHRIQKVMDE